MIHGDFGIMILILRLRMEHYVKNFPLPPIQKFHRHEGVGPSEKASFGGQTGGSANKKKKSILKIQIQFDMYFP